MKTPTIAAFKAWAKDCQPAARAVLMARVFADMERERVDAYVRPIFAGYRFEYDPEKSSRPNPMTDPKDLYLVADLEEPRVLAFYAECEEAHRAHGWQGKAGNCPALTADTLRRAAERALIDLAEPLFDVQSDRLFGDNRAKYLELLIGACFASDRERAEATA